MKGNVKLIVFIFNQVNAYKYFSAQGKFYGIADEVYKYLPKPVLIARDMRRNPVVNLINEID
jgi:hypothetical protein